MPASLTAEGLACQPQLVCQPRQNRAVDKSDFKPRAILAQNLKALMGNPNGPNSQSELKRRSGVSQATIGRILRKEAAATVETLAALAGAYGLEGWQLMVPGMHPTNPPVLQPVSPQERALYERLRATVQDIAKLKS